MGSMHETRYQGAGARPTADGGDDEQIRRAASETTDELKARGREKLDSGKEAAAEQAERIARATQRVADDLGEEDSTLAGYAAQLSRSVQTLADDLRTRSISDIAQDLEKLARRNPTTFLLGSVAVGVALGRFMKASSSTRAHTPTQSQYDSGA